MPIKRKIPYDNGHFFITFTCYNWLSLIGITNSYHLIYNWFDILKKQGHYITGYVIMLNHVHVTIAFSKTTKSINTIVSDGKRLDSGESHSNAAKPGVETRFGTLKFVGVKDRNKVG